jgi:hypothetical protein
MTMKLSDGTDLAVAAQWIRGAVMRAHNIEASATPSVDRFASEYLIWVDDTERILRGIFLDPEAWGGLQTPRYWHICTLSETSRRPREVIRQEVEAQASRLEGMAARIDDYADRMKAAPGIMTVLDTNVLLHYQTPRYVSWQEVVCEPEVRLILPLRVIEELDEKKYLTTAYTADRSRRLLSQLWALLGHSGGSPVELKSGVTIEVPLEDGPRRRGSDADQEVLDLCQDLQAVEKPVVLVTADTGMSLRANGCGIRVCCMPQRFRRLRP